MVCGRCIKVVAGIFAFAGLTDVAINLGTVELEGSLSVKQEQQIRMALKEEGLEWLDNEKVKLVEQVKQVIRQLVQSESLDEMNEKFSVYLSRKLGKEYSYLAAIFSSIENTTLEQFFILQKIEKVKEWLVYNELTLTDIAYRMGYSSVSHLSHQFKNTTGFAPSRFKQLKDHHRKSLDEI